MSDDTFQDSGPECSECGWGISRPCECDDIEDLMMAGDVEGVEQAIAEAMDS